MAVYEQQTSGTHVPGSDLDEEEEGGSGEVPARLWRGSGEVLGRFFFLEVLRLFLCGSGALVLEEEEEDTDR